MTRPDDIPADFEPGYTMHKVEDDIEFLAFAMGEHFESFIDLCVWKAKHRRERSALRAGVIDHIQEPH